MSLARQEKHKIQKKETGHHRSNQNCDSQNGTTEQDTTHRRGEMCGISNKVRRNTTKFRRLWWEVQTGDKSILTINTVMVSQLLLNILKTIKLHLFNRCNNLIILIIHKAQKATTDV